MDTELKTKTPHVNVGKNTEHTKCSTWHANTICHALRLTKLVSLQWCHPACNKVLVWTSQCFPHHRVVLLKVPPSEHLCPRAENDLEATWPGRAIEPTQHFSTQTLVCNEFEPKLCQIYLFQNGSKWLGNVKTLSPRTLEAL